jgi:HTH-type transcriptional regulator, competence development regulator
MLCSSEKVIKVGEQNFAETIRAARLDKGYSQRQLAKLVKVEFTYLSRLENNRAETPPSEVVVRSLAEHLDLDADKLVIVAGRTPQEINDWMRENVDDFLALYRKVGTDSDQLKRLNIQSQLQGNSEETF